MPPLEKEIGRCSELDVTCRVRCSLIGAVAFCGSTRSRAPKQQAEPATATGGAARADFSGQRPLDPPH